MDYERVEWVMRGSLDHARVVRAQDVRSGERAFERSGAFAAQQVRTWFGDARTRSVLISLYEELARAAAYTGDGLSIGEHERQVVARIERAFHDREIVLLGDRHEPLPLVTEHLSATALGPADHRPTGVEDDWIEVGLFDSSGNPIAGAPFTVQHGTTALGEGTTADDGLARVGNIPPRATSTCSVSFAEWAQEGRALPTEAQRIGAPKLDTSRARVIDGPHLVLCRELVAQQAARLLSTNVVQLRRRSATVIELEHFTENGAVFLPGLSPAKLRPTALPVAGIDALRTVFARATGEQRVVVAGHHETRSANRAKGVLLLLTGKRSAWAAHACREATDEDKDHIRAWSLEPLPENGDWTEATWCRVFDLYMRELAGAVPPPKFTKHPHIVVRKGKNFVPHVVAHDATGRAERYVEMNELNPTKPIPGDRGWHPTWPGETVNLPDSWDPFIARLKKAGWDAYPGEREDPAPPPLPRLDPDPREAACGGRHVSTPHADSVERRAVERHVEVLVLHEDGAVCSADLCDTLHCEVYDPSAYDLDYATVSAVPVLHVSRVLPGRPDAQLLVFDSVGAELVRLPSQLGAWHEDVLRFSVRPDQFTGRIRLAFLTPDGLLEHGDSFDARHVADALANRDVDRADALLDGGAEAIGGGGQAANGPQKPKVVLRVRIEWANGTHRLLQQQTLQVSIHRPDGSALDGTRQVNAAVFDVEQNDRDLELRVVVRSPRPAHPDILSFKQRFGVGRVRQAPLLFPNGPTNKNGGLHPRLTMGDYVADPTGVVTVAVDLSFLDITEHVRALGFVPEMGLENATFRFAMQQQKKCRILVLEHTPDSTTWILAVPPSVKPSDAATNVLLFFQHEYKDQLRKVGDKPDLVPGFYKTADDVNYARLVTYLEAPETRGSYLQTTKSGPASVTTFKDYPTYDWDEQLAASGKPVVFVMPLPRGTDYGLVMSPLNTAKVLAKSLIDCLWGDGTLANEQRLRPALRRLAISGFSSGVKTILDNLWISAAAPLVDEAYIFDGLNEPPKPTDKPPKPTDPPEKKYQASTFEAWLNAKSGRRLRLIGTAYTEMAAIGVAKALGNKFGDRVSCWPNDPMYWYQHPDFLAALGNERLAHDKGPPLQAPNATTASNVHLVESSLPKLNADNVIDQSLAYLKLRSDSATGKVHIMSEAEAAALIRYSDRFNKVYIDTPVKFAELLTKLDKSGVASERNTTYRLRHPWSVFGGERVGNAFVGYFRKCLSLSGF
jgi:hypothetical protein